MKKVSLYISCFFIFSSAVFCNWFDVNSEKVKERILELSFVSADTGFAVGWGSERSVFLRTYDGGQSWNVQSFTGLYLFNVHALSAKEVYVTGYSQPCLCGLLMSSTDGGSNWRATEFDDVNNPYSYGITDFFKKDDTSYAVTGYKGSILLTSNSGARWYPAQTKADEECFRYISFPSNDIAYAVSGYSYEMQTKIYKSKDWGETWTNVADLTPTNTYISNLYINSRDTGFVCGMSQGRETILRTVNGGSEWNLVYLGDESYTIIALKFTGEDTIYAVNDFGKILRSTNSGLLWEYYAGGTEVKFNTADIMMDDELPVAYAAGPGLIYRFDLVTNGINDSERKNSSFYPNPVSDFAYIKFDDENGNLPTELRVYDEFGSVLMKKSISSKEMLLALSNLTSGIYFYSYTYSGGISRRGSFIKY